MVTLLHRHMVEWWHSYMVTRLYIYMFIWSNDVMVTLLHKHMVTFYMVKRFHGCMVV